ncbi:hypothetical protein PG990_014660 [Apiospora arundinis]
MSFGFSVGDFLAVIDLANKVRKDFVGAPKQFYNISTEIRNLEYAFRDIDVFISGDDITDTKKQELGSIRDSCQDVLIDCQHLQTKYSALKSPAKGLKQQARGAWQRLSSEPSDVRDLRSRITSNIIQLNRFNDGFTRDNVARLVKGQDESAERQGQQDRQEILDWLTPIDFAAQQSDFFRRRQSGTGQWLLDSPEYRKWVGVKEEALLCPGMPGAGKTILSSIVVDNLLGTFHGDSSIGICYAYCSFRRDPEQTFGGLVASLLKQLTRDQSPFPRSVEDLYDRHKQRQSRPSSDELCRALFSVAAAYSRVLIVVDALDECPVSGGCRSQFISELHKLQAGLGANILVTSRFIPEVTDRFPDAVQMEIRASKSDVDAYLNGNLLHLPGFVSRDLKLQVEIKQSITRCVDGMFLLAQLHLNSLRGKRSPKAVRVALEKLAKGSNAYDTAYYDAMARINSQIPDRKELAHQTLSWIICAKRRLTTTELQHALGVELNEPGLDEDSLPDLQDLVSSCCGLVTIDEKSDVVRLIHYTAQEYFERSQTNWFPDAQSEITEICTTYLAFDDFANGACQNDVDFEKRLFTYPLYGYASHHWGDHAYSVSGSHSLFTFLSKDSNVEAAAQGLSVKQCWPGYDGYSQRFPKHMIGLHLASFFGLHSAVAVLIQHQSINGTTSENRTPLSYAAEGGHKAVVRLLLERKAEADSKDQYDITPLAYAAEGGHEAVVRLLLKHNVDIDSKQEEGMTPLSCAAQRGHEAVVQLLFEHEAEVNSRNYFGWTPLLCAAQGGYQAIIQLLLEHNAEADPKDEFGRTPLSYAAEGGHEAVVRLLLDHMAEVDSKATRKYEAGMTPLSYASGGGHEAVVRLLLEHNAEVDLKDPCGRTSLSYAARGGYEAVVRLLLEHKAEPWLMDNCKRPPLFYAIRKASIEVLELLLRQHESGINIVDCYGSTPLSIAARLGRCDVVAYILGFANVDVTTTDNFHRSPLWWAQNRGYVTITERLLEHDRRLCIDTCKLEAIGETPQTYDLDQRTCEICLTGVEGPYFNCAECNGGGFDICSGCRGQGAVCLVESHELFSLDSLNIVNCTINECRF